MACKTTITMINYLIRFDELKIIAILPASPTAEILGINNQHIVTNLTTAMAIFENMGYDITPLVEEYSKPEEIQE